MKIKVLNPLSILGEAFMLSMKDTVERKSR